MIPCQRHLFDIPDDVTYLNCAYMSPLMRSVVAAGQNGLQRKVHPWEISPEDFFIQVEELRTSASRLFHCAANDVAIVSSASYGISSAARNLPLTRGQKVLVLEEQFPSNYYPWVRLAQERDAEIVIVKWPQDGDWTSEVLHELRDGVAIAALPQTHWTSGGLLDLAKIGADCRRLGTALVLDLTQSLGAFPFDVQTVQPDFCVAATYKWLMGPYALGAMYVAPKWQGGKPLEENWVQRANARIFAELDYTEEYLPGARRFDVGERANFALVPAAKTAIDQLVAWGPDEISSTIGVLNQRLVESVRPFGMIAPADHLRAPHYLCLRSARRPPPSLVDNLAKERVFVSLRRGSLRITPHVYNSEADIDRLFAVLQKTLSRSAQ